MCMGNGLYAMPAILLRPIQVLLVNMPFLPSASDLCVVHRLDLCLMAPRLRIGLGPDTLCVSLWNGIREMEATPPLPPPLLKKSFPCSSVWS